MRHEESTLSGEGGARIYWQAWLPDGTPRASVVLAHGVSEHSGRYEHVGARLVRSGYAVYAPDHRGHGRSEGSGANIERMALVVDDLFQLVQLVTERDGGRKPFLLGHSMGGAVSLAYTAEHEDSIRGLVLSGPAVAEEAASRATRWAARIASEIAPNLGVYEVESSGVSRDPEVVRAYDEDPLVHHGKLPARTAGETLSAARSVPAQAADFRLPLLVMHGGADPIIPVAASRMVAGVAGSEDKTLRIHDGLYHEILNEPEQDEVMDEIVAWLDQRS